jgi:hypothetical protein
MSVMIDMLELNSVVEKDSAEMLHSIRRSEIKQATRAEFLPLKISPRP